MPASQASAHSGRRTSHLLPERSQINKWSNDELQDRYLRMYEENVDLKRRLNNDEERLKKNQKTRNLLAVKLLKLSKDKPDDGMQTDLPADVQNYLLELEQQNMLLRDKLKSTKYQLNAYTRFPLAPNRTHRSQPDFGGRTARSKISAAPGTTLSPMVPLTISIPTPAPPTMDTIVPLQQAEEIIGQLREQIGVYQTEIAALKSEMVKKQISFQEDMNRLQNQYATSNRTAVQENIEIIRMQNVVRDKNNEMNVLRVKLNQQEIDIRNLKSQHDAAVLDNDQIKARLHAEEAINSQLQLEIQSLRTSNTGSMSQLTHQVESLQKENHLLKEAQDKLLSNALNTEKDTQWDLMEKTLRNQITALEAAIKSNAATRNELLEKLANELSEKDQTQQRVRQLESQTVLLKSDNEDLRQKLNKLTTSHGADQLELEEALIFIRQKQKAGEKLDLQSIELPKSVSESADKSDPTEHLANLQLLYAETMQELEKTRNMLLIQHKINQDFKAETLELTTRSEIQKNDYERKLREYTTILSERALKIQKLERQLYNLAYGSRPSRSAATPKETVDVALEAGRNIIDLHFSELNLSDEALRFLQTPSPTTFLTIEFYDFEIQFTPMLVGKSSVMDFTCQYEVVVGDFFLHYMQTECACVELHQAVGGQYKTWAAGRIYMKDIVDDTSNGKVVGKAELLGVSPEASGKSFGVLTFSLQLHVPTEKALQLYRERINALGYVLNEDEDDSSNQQANMNHLHIYIHRCNNLKSNSSTEKPSAYAVYRFFDFPDHDTKIEHAQDNPNFSDHISWPVVVNKELDQYIRQQTLRICIFDDSAPNDDVALLGIAEVPLLPLAHNKNITGTFKLKQDNDSTATVDLSLNWQFAYIPPPTAELLSDQIKPLMVARPTASVDKTGDSGEDTYVVKVPKALAPVRHQHTPQLPVLPAPKDEPETSGQRQDQPQPTLVRVEHRQMLADNSGSATSDPDRESPERKARRTWDRKPPAAPRRQKVEPPPPLPKPAAPTSELSTDRSDSLSVSFAVSKPAPPEQLAQSTSSPASTQKLPDVLLEIQSIWLPESSPLLSTSQIDGNRKVYVTWSFLDFPNSVCRTDGLLELPKVAGYTAHFNTQQKYSMNSTRLKRLQEIATSEESLILCLKLVRSDSEEELGKARVNYKDMRSYGKDLENAMTDVISTSGELIAVLNFTIRAWDALRTKIET